MWEIMGLQSNEFNIKVQVLYGLHKQKANTCIKCCLQTTEKDCSSGA